MKIAVRATYDDEDGRKVSFREFNDLDDDIQEVLRRGWILYLAAVKKRANTAILKRDKRGRVYKLKIKGGYRRHKSSRSPQSHANMHGDLRKSLSWKVVNWHTGRFGYGISTNKSNPAPKYAPWVEGGTRRMRPRPSLHNSVNREKAEPHWDKAFDKVFR